MRRISRMAAFLTLGLAGVAALLGGLSWDAVLHARDLDLAAHEGSSRWPTPATSS